MTGANTSNGPGSDERLDVIVIGAGQAGLAAAWHLAQRGLRFVVLEAADQLGSSWRGRWDSLRLFSPAQYDALPGMAFPAPADTCPGKEAVAEFLRDYATRFEATTLAVSNKVWISAGRRGSTQHDSFRRVRSEGREQDPRQSNGRPDHMCRLMAVR